MANPEHLKILKQGVEAWNRWREEKPDQSIDLSGADLREAKLKGAELWSAKLVEADLSGADLRRAILEGAELRGANFVDADLSGANLMYANLAYADLSFALLVGANLRLTGLQHARFPWATVSDADFRGAALLSEETIFFEQALGTGDSFFLNWSFCIGVESAVFSDDDYPFPDNVVGDTVTEVLQEAIEHQECEELYADSNPPEILVETVQTISVELIKYLAENPEALFEIKPRRFEELIAEILASYGWQVNLTKATRDGGYDIFAISRDLAGAETSWVIECKRNRADRKVGIDVARALYGVKTDLKAASMMLATTSHFSRDLQAYKTSRYDLELRDYEGIVEWINEYRPNPNGRLYIKDNRLIVPGDEE